MKKIVLSAGALCLVSAVPAAAAPIIGNGDPLSDAALAGGTQVTFTGQSGSYNPFVDGGLTISGPNRVSGDFANGFNTFGESLDNDQGATNSLLFSFGSAVSALGFNFGASDSVWTLEIFSGATSLETLAISPTFGSNDKAFFGLTGTNITSATLSGDQNDYIFVDNFTYVADAMGAVPEPATWAFMIFGFGAIGGAMRRQRKANVKVSYA